MPTQTIFRQSKGKSKAIPASRATDGESGDDGDEAEQMELEDDVSVDESYDSGSEFQLSASDVEENMISAAIHMSLQTISSQSQNNGAGPSSSRLISSNPRAALHAAAAERRLASAIGNMTPAVSFPPLQTLRPAIGSPARCFNTVCGKPRTQGTRLVSAFAML